MKNYVEVDIEIEACIHSFMLCEPFLGPVDCPCCIPFPLGFNGYARQFVLFVCGFRFLWVLEVLESRGSVEIGASTHLSDLAYRIV